MSENQIAPIGGLRAAEADAAAKPKIVDAQAKLAAQKPKSNEHLARVKENSAEPAENPGNVSIRFQVDDKTKELVVLVVDQKSKRILRSIPASELHKYEAEGLLILKA
jgi:uncharacterized FlaG/YvyC family protein